MAKKSKSQRRKKRKQRAASKTGARTVRPILDDRDGFTAAMDELSHSERTRIFRAHTMLRTADNKRDAQLLVMISRDAQKLWARLWPLGIVAGLLRIPAPPLDVVLAVAGTMATMWAFFWLLGKHAELSEAKNLPLADPDHASATAEASPTRDKSDTSPGE